MGKPSTRSDYMDENILSSPGFIACIEDVSSKDSNLEIFIRWLNGETPSNIAKGLGKTMSNVTEHLQRIKATYDILAGREITPRWEKYGLRRIIAVKSALAWGCFPAEVNPRALTVATRNFNEYYLGCQQPPELLLAIASYYGLSAIPNAGPICRELYFKAKEYWNARCGGLRWSVYRDLIDLRSILQKAADDGECTDLALARLMDFGIFNCNKFYKSGWTILYKKQKVGDTEFWGVNPNVLRRAYSYILKKMHPNVEDPMVVLVTYRDHDGKLRVKECRYGIPKADIRKIADEFSKDGWQTGVSGRLPVIPVKEIYIRRGENNNV